MKSDYLKALKLGEKETKKYRNNGQFPYPSALEYILPTLSSLSKETIGVVEVPSSMITGTLTTSRQQDFSPSFYPLREPDTEFAIKWNNLYEAQISEGIRDPVKVYEFMQKFYVVEGNKRVSVLKTLNAPSILANVTRVIPRDLDENEQALYSQFVKFYRVCPLYEIAFSKPESYNSLAEHLGQDLENKWSEDTIVNVRSAYLHFEKYFTKFNGKHHRRTIGDAFLSYIYYFSLDSLLNDNEATLDRRFKRIQSELLTAENRAHIAWQETVPPTEKPAGILDILSSPSTPKCPIPLNVAFIHDLNAAESGRIFSHEKGRVWMEERFDGLVKTYSYENCLQNEDFDKAIADAREKGCKMIFTTSPALLPRTLIAAIQHPDIYFLNCSINLSHSAVRLYDGRMYECKYLMGALAASYADNHKIGYLAGSPVYGTIANINAFAIGASMIDPKVEIYLNWTSKKDNEWYEPLLAQGVSVLSDIDSFGANYTIKRYGVYKYRDDGSIMQLASPVWSWGKYYEAIIKTVISGTYEAHALAKNNQAMNYWLGMASGVIDIDLSDNLPYQSRKMIEGIRRAIIEGTLEPFCAELHSQNGIIHTADDPALTREEILTMDWLNDNVIGEIPPVEQLTEASKSMAAVTGVKKEEGTEET